MNTLNQTTLPRQFFTGSMIAIAHGVLLLLIVLNPVRTLPNPFKETIVMMVPSALTPNKIALPSEKLEKRAPTPDITIPAAPIVTIQNNNNDIVAAAPVNAPPAPTPSAVQGTTIAHTEPAGPKQVSSVEYIQAPQADYPPMARRMGEEGRVVMQVLVNDKGHAERVEIIKSSGFARLDDSARLALQRALFKPYFEDGKAMMVLATASINFSLRG